MCTPNKTGAISKNLLTPCRRLGLTRKIKTTINQADSSASKTSVLKTVHDTPNPKITTEIISPILPVENKVNINLTKLYQKKVSTEKANVNVDLSAKVKNKEKSKLYQQKVSTEKANVNIDLSEKVKNEEKSKLYQQKVSTEKTNVNADLPEKVKNKEKSKSSKREKQIKEITKTKENTKNNKLQQTTCKTDYGNNLKNNTQRYEATKNDKDIHNNFKENILLDVDESVASKNENVSSTIINTKSLQENVFSTANLSDTNDVLKTHVTQDKYVLQENALPKTNIENVGKKSLTKRLSMKKSKSVSSSQSELDLDDDFILSPLSSKKDSQDFDGTVVKECTVNVERLLPVSPKKTPSKPENKRKKQVIYSSDEESNESKKQMILSSDEDENKQKKQSIHPLQENKSKGKKQMIYSSDEDDFVPSGGSAKLEKQNHKDKDSVIQDILNLQDQIKLKQNQVDNYKQAKIYKKLHNVGELTKLYDLWKNGCKNALEDLLIKLQEHGPMDMPTLLSNLKIPPNIISYSSEENILI